MRNVISILVFIFLLLAGCSPGGNSIVTNYRGVTVSGSGEDGLEFVLFTDMDEAAAEDHGNTKSGILSSRKAGPFEAESDKRINWSADSTSINISGHEYSFAKGRIFLISANGGSLEIQQLDLPINKSRSSFEEMKRLSMFPQVKDFFASKNR